MSELPQSWADAKLGDVCLVFESRDPGWNPDAEFTYVDIGAIDNKTQTIAAPKRMLGADAPSRARRVIKADDVLFSTVRTYLKNIAMVPQVLDGAFTSTGIAVLRAGDGVEPRYLFNWVTSDEFITEISKSQDGTLYPAVTDKDVFEAGIRLAPVPEQRRIVAKVDGLTARTARARKELDRIPTLIARYKQRLLALAFSGELTFGWREEKSKSHGDSASTGPAVHADDSERGVWEWEILPPGWKWEAFGSAFIDVTDSKRKIQTSEYREEGRFPVIDQGIAEIAGYSDREDVVQLAEPPYIVFGDHTRCVKLVRTRFIQGADGVKVLKPTAVFDAAYLYFALQCVRLPDKGYSRHMKFLRATHFPRCPLDEQAEIVRRIESAFGWLDRMATDHAAAARLLPKLDAAILAKAFRGKLVPQDPNDEPASVLLEQIKLRRQSLGDVAKGRSGRNPKGSRAQSMTEKPLAPRDRLLKDSENWPAIGLPFEAIAMRNAMPHDALRDALFELLSGPSPALQQRFDTDAEVMVIQRVAA